MKAERETVLGEKGITEVEHHQNERYGLTHITNEFFTVITQMDHFWSENFKPGTSEAIIDIKGKMLLS